MEKAIRKRLTQNPDLCRILTSFGEEPAVFYARTVDDVAMEVNYPQIVLSVDKFTDAIHGVAGLLSVEIICTTATLTPEPIEKLVRESLEGVFFKGEEIFLLKWSRTENFEEPAAERTATIIGMQVTFEIREFPCAITSTPDPIMALNEWAAHWDGNLFVIGHSEIKDFYEPTKHKPAIYFDVASSKVISKIYSVVWLEAVINCHLFAPKVRDRREWLTALSHAFMSAKAIPLLDHSPMRLQEPTPEINWSADEIAGQMKLTVAYGLPKRRVFTIPVLQGTQSNFLKVE